LFNSKLNGRKLGFNALLMSALTTLRSSRYRFKIKF